MEPVKPYQKVINELTIQIFKNNLHESDKIPPSTRLAEQLAVDATSVQTALHIMESMNLVQIHFNGEVTVKNYRKHAGIEFLNTIFRCQIFKPQENLINQDLMNQIWSIWNFLLTETIRMAATKATLEDIETMVDILDQELANLHQPETLLELEAMLENHVVKIADNLVITLFFNATAQIRKQLQESFIYAVSKETIHRYTETRKQMLSLFIQDSSVGIGTTIENFRELMDSIWQECYQQN